MTTNTDQVLDSCHSPIDDFGLLSIKGPDASKFLQGQLTCDLRELNHDTAIWGAQCTLKGRVIANFLLLQISADEIFMRLPKSLIQKVAGSLGKYIVFSKAKIADLSDNFSALSVVGSGANQLLMNSAPFSLEQNLHWSYWQQGILVRFSESHFEYWQSNDIKLADDLDTQLTLSGNSSQLELIRAGVATVLPETSELLTPQDLNLSAINAVSFKKGCYTGQEIVARMHYRGTQKRHLFRVEGSSNTSEKTPTPGDKLVTSVGKEAGQLINIALTQSANFEALVSVYDEYIDDLHLESSGAKLTRLPLPYAIHKA